MASSNRPSVKQSNKANSQPSQSGSTKKWPSISKLWKSSEHKRPSTPPLLCPDSKRRKTGESSPTEPGTYSSSTSISDANMYNFSGTTRGTGGDVVVDLTGSSPPSAIPPRSKTRRLSLAARVDNASPGSAVKQIPVKNFRTEVKSDRSEYCKKTFSQLGDGLSAIFKDLNPSLSNEELYRGVENLCRLDQAPELTTRILERFKEHIFNDYKKPVLTKVDHESTDVLKAVLNVWANWNKQLLIIRAIFCFLDRSYLLRQRLPSVYESGITLFSSTVFKDAQLKPKIIDGAYQLLLADRIGGVHDQALFKDAIKMFHDLQVYSSDFEPYMLTKSQGYIHAWADKECSERDLPSYVSVAVELMNAEMARCDQFDLDISTRRELLTLLEDHLIARKETELINPESVADLLDQNNKDAVVHLEHLFSLLQRRRIGTKLRPAFSTWIDETGTSIIFDEKEQDLMVVRLLALKQKLDNIWRESFHKNEELGHALRESFEHFINKSKKTSATWNTDNSKPGEMIAKYVDMLLKTGAKAIPISLSSSTPKPAAAEAEDEGGEDEDGMDEDTEVNNQLDQVLDLFRFVHGKAVFEAFYKKDLARRLLMGRSASADAEKNMLARLKTECGAGFTQNLEQMFKDVELAREEMNAYKSRLHNNEGKHGIDLNVNILSAAAWPTYPDVPVAIPSEIKRCIDNFEKHYNQKHSGRKLQWKHALAHCQLKASFPKGDKELVVSSFQAIVLCLFNRVGKEESLTYDHIKSESGLSPSELNRTLQSLACAKLRPLSKQPKGRDVNPTDTFTINTSFSHPKYRVKINSIQLKETKEENKETHVRVAADRQFETQAAIVRIMKSRKTITHAELVAEVISATRSRGVMAVGDIKKNIDKLIEKEYIERTEGNTYSYLA